MDERERDPTYGRGKVTEMGMPGADGIRSRDGVSQAAQARRPVGFLVAEKCQLWHVAGIETTGTRTVAGVWAVSVADVIERLLGRR